MMFKVIQIRRLYVPTICVPFKLRGDNEKSEDHPSTIVIGVKDIEPVQNNICTIDSADLLCQKNVLFCFKIYLTI